ncbi:hypothetical protein OE88DRAFT_1657283 [Heliocybe sulcata]|uniref:Uncharacterized protein n=1 Tax=Heliocybe sulcata TaxID=5364 RepID=A0A5C3N6Q8_9AGAM|nr:hypothetical protein OE88DRAFT_1657283 [Heliocybe sulcata]
MHKAFRSIHPHEVLLAPVPPPPASLPSYAGRYTHDFLSNNRSLILRLSPPAFFSLRLHVIRLTQALTPCHRRTIAWPILEPRNSSNIRSYYLDVIAQPVTSLFNHLRNIALFPPLACHEDLIGKYTSIVSFSCDVKESIPALKFPVILFLPQNTLDNEPLALSSDANFALRQALARSSEANVICTDLTTVLIIRRPDNRSEDDTLLYERVKLPDLRALRIIIAAYIFEPISDHSYIEVPQMRDDHQHVTFCGPMPDLSAMPMLPDEEIYRTHHRHADFDGVVLTRDYRWTSQFLHWKKWIGDNVSPRILSLGDVVIGETGGFSKQNGLFSPFYKVEKIPDEVLQHIRSIQRPRPMVPLPESSQSFAVELINELTPQGARDGMCRTYTCK